ncbi:MAG: NADH-quinone oxidoreductase subunit NuoF [Nitrospirae bacterium]|nr:MAG: NADH-quinone oxidoreductase subunit NuoF [Nitrospirota bacterium]
MSSVFSKTAQEKIPGILERYAEKRAALLPLLWLAQEEHGYVSEAAMKEIAGLLSLTPPQVYENVTFYTMFNRQPIGKFHIQVCRSLMCALVGTEQLLGWIHAKLGIKPGQTAPDGLFTLNTVECLASCGTGPMMQVNDDYFEQLTQEKVNRILDDLKRDGKSQLASGPFMFPTPAKMGSDSIFSPKTPIRESKMESDPILIKNMMQPGYTGSLADYERAGGYQALRKVLGKTAPADIIEMVKKSGLRGRGGAGFPTGVKWSFIPKDRPGPRYLICNADESEPGTFKDRQLMERDPHQMIEGVILAAYAISTHVAYIYIRGEFVLGAKILENAVAEAYRAGYLGPNILGSGFALDIFMHRGAGAYICGEETALLESMEGKRGLPRTKPPFPATHGLFQQPTVVNNVETLANVPHIVNRGPEWFASIGRPPKSAGTRIFCLSGHVKRPGNYEVPMGITFREMIYEIAGGMRGDKPLKAIIPGGASAAFLTPAHLDVRMDFESVAQAGSMLGSGGVTVMEEGTCMVWAAENLLQFFNHESCGKCTPCREGSLWLLQILRRIEHGRGRQEDLDLLLRLCGNIAGRTVCAFGDAEIAPITSTLQHFRDEYEAHIREQRCPFRPQPAPELITVGH